jgi:hypothetical protein
MFAETPDPRISCQSDNWIATFDNFANAWLMG